MRDYAAKRNLWSNPSACIITKTSPSIAPGRGGLNRLESSYELARSNLTRGLVVVLSLISGARHGIGAERYATRIRVLCA